MSDIVDIDAVGKSLSEALAEDSKYGAPVVSPLDEWAHEWAQLLIEEVRRLKFVDVEIDRVMDLYVVDRDKLTIAVKALEDYPGCKCCESWNCKLCDYRETVDGALAKINPPARGEGS